MYFPIKFATYEKTKPLNDQVDTNTDILSEQFNFNPISQDYLDKLSVMNEDNNEENTDTLITYQPTETSSKQTSAKKSKLVGSKEFENAFKEAIKQDPSVEKYKDFLTRIAKKESGFNSYIQNRAGAPYYGYFQFGHAALKSVSNLTMEQFRKNPVEQIKAGARLYERFIRQSKVIKVNNKISIYDLAKQKGYSDDSIAAGAWAGGLGGVKKFLLGQGDPSDSHWYGGKGGTSVGKRMNEFK